MAEQSGTAIDAATPEPKGAKVLVTPCIGCGGLPHGSTGARINCLESAVAELRRINRMLTAGAR